METATSKGGALALVAVVLALGGCGSTSSRNSSTQRSGSHPLSVAHAGQIGKREPPAFAWLHPGPPPGGWREAAIPSGAKMAYPPRWRLVAGDPGTATAALFDRHHAFLGYLNITPRQSNESLANWGHFRVEHNAKEGDRQVMALAVDSGLRFRSGRGACVKDAYTTIAQTRYLELACLVVGHTSSTVIVGAAPPQAWSRISPLLERAISCMTT